MTIGDFDFGVDQIILQENFAFVASRDLGSSVEFTITYDGGSTQYFTIYGLAGSTDASQIFTTVMPNETMSGGDTVVYSGDASDFDVSYNAATGAFTITDRDTADGLDEGTDTVTGVERFSFDGVEIDATAFLDGSSVAATSFDYDSGATMFNPTATAQGTSGSDSIAPASNADQTVYARGGDDRISTDGGNDAIYAGSGNDSVWGGAGDDTIFGGTGNDSLAGGDGSDTFIFTAMQGSDTVDGGTGWTDVLELAGFGGDITVNATTVDGEGWTLVLEDGHSVTAETLDSLELSGDATGVITFDEGGTIDFTGIDKIVF